MLLIDSIYVNMGGGLSLLKYLVETLQEKGVRFRLLVDARAGAQFPNVADQVILYPSESSRNKFYKAFPQDITSVFCFGNVPPPVKLNVPVYTYFHNINMLTLADCRGWKQLVKFWLKRQYVRLRKKNTDSWFVQTSNTANELIKNLRVSKSLVDLYPFYRPPQKVVPGADKRMDYIFVGDDSGSKGHNELLDAWELLHNKGIDRNLHLTVSSGAPSYEKIQNLINKGVCIQNHGIIPMAEVFALYARCKATVYPSRNESFGLGIVEAMESGCDVIGSDLPFIHAICEPSETFDNSLPKSIAEAVIKYERKPCKTSQTVSNMLGEMIQKIS